LLLRHSIDDRDCAGSNRPMDGQAFKSCSLPRLRAAETA
jgi:hypothetical protein